MEEITSFKINSILRDAVSELAAVSTESEYAYHLTPTKSLQELIQIR